MRCSPGHSLAAFAIGLPVFALVKILTPGFFARGDTMTPLKIGVVAVALNLGLNLVFMHPLKAVGPALATSLSSAFNAVLLAYLLHRRGHFALDAARPPPRAAHPARRRHHGARPLWRGERCSRPAKPPSWNFCS